MNRDRTVAGLDVHKDTIYLCILDHNENILLEKTFTTLTPDLQLMCEEMLALGVSEAAMESTAVYWVPVFEALHHSMEVKVANAYVIKQLPGRKSDVNDARWIAECLLKNLIRGSFVPGGVVQDMRKYNRRIFDLQDDLTYNTNKLDAALQRCGFRLSNYVSKVNGKSYQSVLDKIVAGETDPEKLAECVHGRTINKHGRQTIVAALTAFFHKADIDLIRQIREIISIIERQIQECQKELMSLCEEHFPIEMKRLQTIPAVKERAATAIIAEIGGDMKAFVTAAVLVGWCGLKPRNDVSNGHYKSRKITHGNKFLRKILIEIAWVASRKRNCFFSHFSYVQVTQKHKSKMKIQVAIARKILVAVWHMFSKGEDFVDCYLLKLNRQAQTSELSTI